MELKRKLRRMISSFARKYIIKTDAWWYKVSIRFWKKELLKSHLKKESYGGKNPEITYMMIQKNMHTNSGVFEDYIMFMLAIDFALARGYVPVIDRLNYPGYIQQEEKDWYKKNAWEIYFEQPFYVGVEYVENGAQNVVLCNTEITGDTLSIQPDRALDFFRYLAIPRNETENYFSDHFRFIANKYLRFNEYTRKYIAEKRKEVFGSQDTRNVMAISLREEMFYRGEATGVDCRNIEEKIELYKKKWGYKKLYIATEFDERIEKLQRIFGEENIYHLKRKRAYNTNNIDVQACIKWNDYSLKGTKRVMEIDRKIYGDKFEKWLNYVTEMYLVSVCDGALLQVSSGNISATLMRKEPWHHVAILQGNNIYE